MPPKKRLRLRTTARYGVPLFLGIMALLVLSSIYAFYRGQETLVNLLEHGRHVRTTRVYGRWWTLAPDSGLTPAETLDTLRGLEYQQTPGDPVKPGQFHAAASDIEVNLRAFAYPDGVAPAQRVRLRFSGPHLDAVDAPPSPEGGAWRLEPKLLAQWSTDDTLARRQIQLSELPAYVPQAIVAIEDKRFYKHGAFDAIGMLRALVVDLRHGRLSQGASTLSQQLARSIFLSTRRTLARKSMEAILAAYLEVRFKKEQLLEMYLNQVYWGQDGSASLLGVDAASHAYFGKPPRDLSLAEAALLAGLLQSPNHYSPRNSPAIALERRTLVLKLMRGQGVINERQYEKARAEKLTLAPADGRVNDAAYFLATLEDTLEDRYPGVTLPTAGWAIYTTLDPVLEHAAALAIQRLPHPANKPHPEAALVALDPKTGGVRAWIGGTDYALAPYDRAARAHRQPGSAFKPFVMLAALDQKKATLATLLKDEPLTLTTPQGPWSPQNFDRKYRHQATLWDSLVQSLNVPTVMLAQLTGLSTVADYAHRAGIESPLSPYAAMALGSSEVTLAELTHAYATLAAGGVYRPSYSVETIVDAGGRILEAHTAAPVQAFNPLSVALVTRMLQAVLTEGTGAAAHAMGLTVPAAGKTGTSENFRDAWFVGYSPTLACGVWVGYDQPRSLGRAAAGIALPIWAPFMQKAVSLMGAAPFQEPDGLVTKTVDPETGFLARSGCPTRRADVFLPGTEPTQDCPTHAGGIVGFFHRLLSPTKPSQKSVHG